MTTNFLLQNGENMLTPPSFIALTFQNELEDDLARLYIL